MRTNARTLRPILVLMLCGIVLTAYDIGDSNPAAAMGVLALGAWAAVSAAVRAWAVASAERRRGYGGGPRGLATAPRRGGGQIVDKPPGGYRGGTGTGYDGGQGGRHHPIIVNPGIGGTPVPPVANTPPPGRIGGNNGGGGGGGGRRGRRHAATRRAALRSRRSHYRLCVERDAGGDRSAGAPAQFDATRVAKLLAGRQHALPLAYRRPAAGRRPGRRARRRAPRQQRAAQLSFHAARGRREGCRADAELRGAIRSGQTASRGSASRRDREKYPGRRDRFGNRRQKSGSRCHDRQKLRCDRRRRQTAFARHRHGRRHRRAPQAHGHRARRAGVGSARLRRQSRRQGNLLCHLQRPAMGRRQWCT